MQSKTIIRRARPSDLASVVDFVGQSKTGTSDQQNAEWILHPIDLADTRHPLQEAMDDESVHIAVTGGKLSGLAVLNVRQARLLQLRICASPQQAQIAARLLQSIERRAVCFGIRRIHLFARPEREAFLSAHHYVRPDSNEALAHGKNSQAARRSRSLLRRRTRLARHVDSLLRDLGVPSDYGQLHRLELQAECQSLCLVERTENGREHHLMPAAAHAWFEMSRAATHAGVGLEIVSAFRSFNYQADIIRRKLSAGQNIDAVLKVSAAPGFSEHHSGRALDLNQPGLPPLETTFSDTAAFRWLNSNAGSFGFRMSYPRNNRHGIAYEPWHWAWTG